jgi:rubredoxin
MAKFVMLEFLFNCPTCGHELVSAQVPHLQSTKPKGPAEFDPLNFSLYCPECKWKGSLKGSDRKELRVAGENHKTH